MTAPTSLLVATDFCTDAGHAARRAAQIAAARKARLDLLHVVSRGTLDELREWMLDAGPRAEAAVVADARTQLRALAAALHAESGVTAGQHVAVGRVHEELLAATAHADLLVLGARGASPLRDMLLGSTSERLLRLAVCPILVVRQAPQGPYRRVLVPVDFSAHSDAALALARGVAPDAEVTLVHAYDLPFEGKLAIAGVPRSDILTYRARARQHALGCMTALIDRHGGLPGHAPSAVALDDAPRLILAIEQSVGADLIVIGRQGRGMLDEVLLGSVARHVLADAQCDVLVATLPAAS